MLTPKRMVLSNHRCKQLLLAAIKGDQSIVLVGGVGPRTTLSVPSLRQFVRGAERRILIEVTPGIPRRSGATRTGA
jgi:type IV secretory pathway ATPase VirB11/archaellum biosynthesis ATPase